FCFFFQAEDGIRDFHVTGVQTCALPIFPALPEALDVVFSGGTRGQVPFQWQEITEAMVAETNVEPFVVYGTNSTYGLIAQAQVYVRPEMSEGGISVQGAGQFAQTVAGGQLPYLP